MSNESIKRGPLSVRRVSITKALALALCVSLALAGCSKDKATEQPKPPPTTTSTTPSQTPTPTPKPKPSPTKSSEAPKLTGDPLTGGKKSTNKVFAVKIDNVAAARPQIGVGTADMVVVEEVESDLTRLIAIYHTEFPTSVGPVRSARNTDLRYLPMFGKPGLIFSGANRKVKQQIRKSSVFPSERASRDNSRPAPHNVVVNLKKLAGFKDASKPPDIGMRFAEKDARWSKADKAKDVKVKVASDTFGFDYSKGSYAVSWNGRANTDAKTDKPVKAQNVIVLSVKNHQDKDTTSNLSVVSETVGSGKAVIHRDGKKMTGTWKRDKLNGPMHFTDKSGKDIMLRPGKSWVLLQG